METMTRQSPVGFAARPTDTTIRDHWPVVLAYENEGEGPWLVDASHKPRWDFQDSRPDRIATDELTVPEAANQVLLHRDVLVSRMNATQAAVWHLGTEPAPVMPADTGFTDVTEAGACLALIGPAVFEIAEKCSPMDFRDPARNPPFLIQGPFSHIPCQLVCLERTGGGGALLLSCARGYARDMVAAILKAGGEYGIRPAGENRLTQLMADIVSPGG